MLPLGGPEGHKGYGLSVMVEILSGILTGLGFGHDPSGRHNDGCFMAVFDVATFRDVEEFKAEVDRFRPLPQKRASGGGFRRGFLPRRAGAQAHSAASGGRHLRRRCHLG